MSNNLSLKDCIWSGYPAIHYKTSEESRAIKECSMIASETESVFICWSDTKGFYGDKTKKASDALMMNYDEVLQKGLDYSKDGKSVILCLLDFHHYIKNPKVIRKAKDVFEEAKSKAISYIFIDSEFEIPPELKHEIFVLDMELPTSSDFETFITEMIKRNNYEGISNEEIKKASNALTGLTINEAESAVAISLYKTETLNLDIIYDIKKQIINEDNLLEYYKSAETMDSIGGLQEFKDYAKERSFSAFSEEAREYGLPYPKGVLLLGVPGCGKSLTAKALANMWKVPLVKFDLSKLFGSLVGQTEKNTMKALRIAESMAPCVLWIDELEKGLAGAGNNGKNDSGVTTRMFGSILTWLQEKEKPVYVIATANNINNLPPELLRKGRFDEIFFVDLPNADERRDIFKIQIKKHKRNPEDFDIESFVEITDGYNGAEIEECIVSAMFKAWNDGKRPYTTEDIQSAIETVTPASKGVMKENIDALRKWSKDHCVRNASASEVVKEVEVPTNGNFRAIRRAGNA